jgi:hypothetical protein
MLVAMTYNTYLFFSIVAGSFVGHLLYESEMDVRYVKFSCMVTTDIGTIITLQCCPERGISKGPRMPLVVSIRGLEIVSYHAWVEASWFQAASVVSVLLPDPSGLPRPLPLWSCLLLTGFWALLLRLSDAHGTFGSCFR